MIVKIQYICLAIQVFFMAMTFYEWGKARRINKHGRRKRPRNVLRKKL